MITPASALAATVGDEPRVQMLTSIEQIETAVWNSAVQKFGGGVFHLHEWMRALAAGGMVVADPAHVVLTRGDRISGLAACLITSRCPKLEMFREHYLGSPFAGERIAVVHSMYSQRSQLFAGTDADQARLLDELERHCFGSAGVAALLLPTVAGDDQLLALLRQRGYTIGLLSCVNILPVCWRSFAEYLSSRPSAKRQNIQRGLRTGESAGLRVSVRNSGEAVGILARMVELTARRHGSPQFFDERFLRAIVTEMGERTVTFVAEAAGSVALSCLALRDRGELVPWCIGLDYGSLARYDQYNCLYAALIRYAIDHGVREVNFGRSTFVIKRKYGCIQRPVYAAMTGPPHRRRDREEWTAAIDRRARAELADVGLAVTRDGTQVTKLAKPLQLGASR